jgi:hypothetical protein
MRSFASLIGILLLSGSQCLARTFYGLPDIPLTKPSPDELALKPGSPVPEGCRDYLDSPQGSGRRIENVRLTHSPKYGNIVRFVEIQNFYGYEITSINACSNRGGTTTWLVKPPSGVQRECFGATFPLDGEGFGPPFPPKSLSYLDPKTHILFYVESDGRHLAAIDQDGKLLWFRNPFEDAQLCPYRTIRPIIDSVSGETPDWISLLNTKRKRHAHYIHVQFNSSQFGAVDTQNGDYIDEGQN